MLTPSAPHPLRNQNVCHISFSSEQTGQSFNWDCSLPKETPVWSLFQSNTSKRSKEICFMFKVLWIFLLTQKWELRKTQQSRRMKNILQRVRINQSSTAETRLARQTPPQFPLNTSCEMWACSANYWQNVGDWVMSPNYLWKPFSWHMANGCKHPGRLNCTLADSSGDKTDGDMSPGLTELNLQCPL